MKIKQLLLLFVVMLQITSIKIIAHENYESNIAESIPRGDEVFTTAAQMPSFPGGEKALYEYCGRNIRYPAYAADNNIQGTVIVKFVVEKDGKIGEIQIVRGVDKDLDREAKRVCKSLPKFSPGRNENGDPVRVWYTLPFTFTITENENISIDSDNLVAQNTSHKKPSYSSYLRDEYNPLKGGSLSKGIDYYLTELRNDDPEAMFHIARFAADGIGGVQKDPDMAFQLAEKLAEIGNEDGIALLGRCYAEGIGVEKNKIKAMQLLTQVKNNPYAKAYFGILNNNLDERDVDIDDGYIYYWLAENKLKDLLGLIKEPQKIDLGHFDSQFYFPRGVGYIGGDLIEIFQLYCKAWVMGCDVAGKRVIDFRFDYNKPSSVFYAFNQLPINKYSDQLEKVYDSPWGSILITDLANIPLYCVRQYSYDVWDDNVDDNMKWFDVCFCDEHYALQYTKGKWVEVPCGEDGYRSIKLNRNKVIVYQSFPMPWDTKLWSLLDEKANLVKATMLLEFQHYRDVAIQDSRYCIGGGSDTYVDISLLKAQTEAGIEEAIERYENYMLNKPEILKKYGFE